jgi:drug/metabolite transporter (DMT)-like permease
MIAVKHVDVVIVSLVNNTTPVFVILLAFFMLKERLRKMECFFIALTFGAVIIIILGQKPSGTADTFVDAPFVYIALFCNPLISAGGQVAQKKLSALDELVVTFWP